MRISGKYLLGSSIGYEFSKTSITFVANQERFVAMKNVYEYDDENDASTYTLSFFKEDGTELIVGARISSTTSWYVDESYLLLDVGEEQFVEGGVASLLSNATHQTIYLKAGTYRYNDELVAGGLTATTAPEKQYFDFEAELSFGGEVLKIKQIAIGYHYSSSYYYSYLGYIGNGYTNNELTHENFELPIFNSKEEGAQGEWVANTGIDPKSITLPTTVEVTLACEGWFSANTDYKKIVKVPISGCYAGEGLLDLPDCEEMVNCKFNFGLRRRDGEGLRINSEGIYLYRDGEWKPFILPSDDNLEVIEYQISGESSAINFGENQEVSLGFFEALNNVASPISWAVVCPSCLKNRKWKKVLKPSTIYHTFYNPVDYTTRVFMKFNAINTTPSSDGVLLIVGTLDENGEPTKYSMPYVEVEGGWVSGHEASISNGQPVKEESENDIYLIDPPEYDLEGWESDISSAVLLWEDTETTETKYELGKRKFKQSTTTLKLDRDFTSDIEKYSWLYENRFEMQELFIKEQWTSQLMFSVGPFSPLVEQKNGKLSFALGYLIKLLWSIDESIGVMAFFDIIEESGVEASAEDVLGEEGLFSTLPAQEFTLTAYSEATRDWLLENTDPVEEKTIPKGTYVILHKAPEVWKQKMLDTYGEERFSNTSYFQKIDFTTSIGGKKVLCDEIQLNSETSNSVLKTSLDYRIKGVGLEEIRSTTDTGYWYDDKSRKITLPKDAGVGKTFFDWFVEATDYKLVTGQDSVLGWREFNDTYIPLYDGSYWTTEDITRRYNTYGATISTQKESEFTADGYNFLSSNEVTPPFYYSSSINRSVSLGYVQDATGAMQQLGYLDPLRSGKVHNLLAVENQVAAAWFYEHTTPVAEKIIPQGRYLFKSEITKPEGWDTMENGWEMPIELSLQYNNENFEITKIRINADNDSLDLYAPAHVTETLDGWEETYLYTEGRWYAPELSSWFVKKNTKATVAQYNWFMENAIRISGPHKIKEDAAAISYTFDPAVLAQRKTALNTHKIAIQPQKMSVEENTGWLFGITPKMCYDGTNTTQFLGGIFDPPTEQAMLVMSASETYVAPTYIDIIDVASLEIAQWVVANTEEADEVAGCWKWIYIDKIIPPEEEITQKIDFDAWEDGEIYYQGKEIVLDSLSTDSSIAAISTKDNEGNIREHGEDESTNGSARTFYFGRSVQVVDKQFGDFLRQYATPDHWEKYHFEASGKWVWDDNPNITDFFAWRNPPKINGVKYGYLVLAQEQGLKVIYAALTSPGELITLYSSLTGWQETQWTQEEVNLLIQSGLSLDIFATGRLTDKWKTLDLGEETAHLNADQAENLKPLLRSLKGKEFEKLTKTDEFVSEANNKSFQKIAQ